MLYISRFFLSRERESNPRYGLGFSRWPLPELHDRAAARVRSLHDQGARDAYLYGAPGTPGATGDLRHLHAFFLLTDRPEVYNLPAAPSRGAARVWPSLMSGVVTAVLITAVTFGLLAAL